MADARDPEELVTVEDLAISSMWEIAALVEVLERKVITRQELHHVSRKGVRVDSRS